jgi:outer membrane protein TolC
MKEDNLPAWAEEIATFQTLRWRSPFGALPQRAQRALEIREEALRMSRELDRLMVEQAQRGEAAPAVVLQATAGLERATIAVLRAREDVGTWSRQLNRLIGRDPQARLVVTRDPRLTPTAAIQVGLPRRTNNANYGLVGLHDHHP